MTINIELPFGIEHVMIDRQTVVSVNVLYAALKDWCVNLFLLSQGHISRLSVRNQDLKRLTISVGDVTQIDTIQEKHIIVVISASDMSYLQAMLLRYIRDGRAEVDHIDLQAGNDYITWRFDQVADPISQDELKRRIGL